MRHGSVPPRETLSQQPPERLSKAKRAVRDETRQRVHLVAAMLTADAPLAEVLAVVPEQVVAVLSESRACTAYHFRAIVQTRLSQANPYFSSLGEPPQRDFLDATVTQSAAVLQHLTSTGIDPVMRVTATRRDQVCTKRRLSPQFQCFLKNSALEITRCRKESGLFGR